MQIDYSHLFVMSSFFFFPALGIWSQAFSSNSGKIRSTLLFCLMEEYAVLTIKTFLLRYLRKTALETFQCILKTLQLSVALRFFDRTRRAMSQIHNCGSSGKLVILFSVMLQQLFFLCRGIVSVVCFITLRVKG